MKKTFAGAILALASLAAFAAPITTQGSLTRGDFEFSPTVTGTVNVGGQNIGAIYIGAMDATFLPTDNPFGDIEFLMFCADLFQMAASKGLDVTYDKIDYVTEMNPYDKIGQLFTATGGLTSVDASGSAAMQLAIWNLLYDTDLDVSTGNFKVVNVTGTDVVEMANGMLEGSAGGPNLWNVSYLSDFEYSTALDKSSKQDYITASFNSGGGCILNPDLPDCNTVPEPAGLALAGLGLFALGVTRRRKTAVKS